VNSYTAPAAVVLYTRKQKLNIEKLFNMKTFVYNTAETENVTALLEAKDSLKTKLKCNINIYQQSATCSV
jgi:hypothetical protein